MLLFFVFLLPFFFGGGGEGQEGAGKGGGGRFVKTAFVSFLRGAVGRRYYSLYSL